MRRIGLAVLAVAAVVPLASCAGGDDAGTSVLTLRGRARLAGGISLVAGRHQLEPGDEVTITAGTAVLDLGGRASLELRAGLGSRADSQVHVGPTPLLVAGDALVVTDGRPGRLRAGAAVATVEGIARVSRSTGATLAMYEGRAWIDALGRSLSSPVGALRQVAVGDTGSLPRRPVPLVYDRDRPDPWDSRYLGDAIDLGDQLERRSRALDRQLEPASRTATPDYVRAVLPALRSARGFDDGLVDGRRSVGETVVGASIALGGPGALADRWRAAFSFRSEGADWGLVAVDQRARRSSVFDVLDGVLDAAALRPLLGGDVTTSVTASPAGPSPSVPPSPTTTVASGPAQPTTTTTGPVRRRSTSSSSTTAPSPTTPTTSSPTTPTTSSPPTTSPSTTSPTTSPPPTSSPTTAPPLTIITDPLGDLVDDLLGTVGGLLGPTSG